MENWKIDEKAILERLKRGKLTVPPLKVKAVSIENSERCFDAILTLILEESLEEFTFAVEAKSRSSPLVIQSAIAQIKAAAQGKYPMIIVPYLSDSQLKGLESQNISGIDLSGNCLVNIPQRLYICRTGQPNRYPESRPLSNPYAGKSSMVARSLLARPKWQSQSDISQYINKNGIELSVGQISKAVSALRDDLVLIKLRSSIELSDKVRLLDELARAWRKPLIRNRLALRLIAPPKWSNGLSEIDGLKWSVTGESSVTRYTNLNQEGPIRVAVSSIGKAMIKIKGTPERVTNFAHIELLETDDDCFYFQNEEDEKKCRWASKLQTWLELQSGDARQRDASEEIRNQILYEITL